MILRNRFSPFLPLFLLFILSTMIDNAKIINALITLDVICNFNDKLGIFARQYRICLTLSKNLVSDKTSSACLIHKMGIEMN